MRRFTKIITIIVALTAMVSCFQEEKQGTNMRIALHSQNVTTDPIQKTQHDIEAYAFYVDKGTEWEVLTWEDALNHVATNKKDANKVLTQTDVIGSYDPNAEYQLSLGLWSQYTFIVVVDKTTKIYASRFYETPVNIPEVLVQLHLYAHKKSGSANGWNMVNPFPDETREPLVPVEEEEDIVDDNDNTDDNTGDNEPEETPEETPEDDNVEDETEDEPNNEPEDGNVEEDNVEEESGNELTE